MLAKNFKWRLKKRWFNPLFHNFYSFFEYTLWLALCFNYLMERSFNDYFSTCRLTFNLFLLTICLIYVCRNIRFLLYKNVLKLIERYSSKLNIVCRYLFISCFIYFKPQNVFQWWQTFYKSSSAFPFPYDCNKKSFLLCKTITYICLMFIQFAGICLWPPIIVSIFRIKMCICELEQFL